jgi:hypothetical protein
MQTVWVLGIQLPCQIEELVLISKVLEEHQIFGVEGHVSAVLALV